MSEEASHRPPGLRRMLRATDYFTLAFGSIVGVGWMVVINGWLDRGGPGGAMLAFLLGGAALTPVVFVYGRLARRLPETASEIAYTAAVFPRSISFATGWVLTFAYLIVCPFEAVAIGQLAAYAFPAFNSGELYQVAGQPVYLPHVLVGLGTTAAITWLNYRGIRFSALFQNWTTFGLLAIFALFAVLGCARGQNETLQPLFAGGNDWTHALPATLAVLPIVPYYLMGFETIPKCADEAAADFDPRRFVRIMLLALGVGTFFYVTVIGVVARLQPWEELRDSKYATALAFERAFGGPWLARLMMFGAMLSLLKVFNGNFLTATRLFWAMGQRDLLGVGLGAVDVQRQTPAAAIWLVGGSTALASLLGTAVLDPISEVGSLAIALGWLAASLALARGAGGELTVGDRLLGASGATVSICLAAIVVSVSFSWPQWLTVGAWAALGLAVWGFRRPRNAAP